MRKQIHALLVGITLCGAMSPLKLLAQGNEDPPKKLTLPVETELEKARELARTVYGDKVKAAVDNDAKVRLAAELLRDARDNAGDPPAYFVVLHLATNLAAASHDVPLAMEAIQVTDDAFKINADAERLETLGKISAGDTRGKQHRIIASYYYSFAAKAIGKGDQDSFDRFMGQAIDVARRAKNTALVDQLESRKTSLKGGLEFAKQRGKLLTDPADPAANFAVGRHACIADGKWEVGLPMLALADQAKWTDLAQREIKMPASPLDMISLAAGWYELAASEDGAARNAILRHALDWYRKALPGLKGLRYAADKEKAERRIAEIEKLTKAARPEARGPILDDDSPFSGRSPENRRLVELWYGSDGGTKETERAVGAALYWLAHHQMREGNWSLKEYTKLCKDKTCTGVGAVESYSAATAMGLLPYLAAGQTHSSAGPFQQAIRSGVYWLITHQKPDGDLSAGAEQQMYSHGLAAIALCEDYGMSKDKGVAMAAQKAIKFIQSAQNKKTGGWRYHPGEEGDTSVVGWELMALKSAQMAGLSVDPAVLDGAHRWLKSVDSGGKEIIGAGGARFSYQPGDEPKPSMTAVGLLCSQYLHAGRQDSVIVGGVQNLMANPPDDQSRNVYYWYYATQVMHNMADKDWDTWNRKMRKILVATQARDGCATGSWDPDKPTRDAWGPQGGRIMMTSLACLTLEIYYRYPPIYGDSRLPPNLEWRNEPQQIPGAPLDRKVKPNSSFGPDRND